MESRLVVMAVDTERGGKRRATSRRAQGDYFARVLGSSNRACGTRLAPARLIDCRLYLTHLKRDVQARKQRNKHEDTTRDRV